MNIATLMSLSVAERTDVLEQLAHRQGLETAPGDRHEGEVLKRALGKRVGYTADVITKTLWAHYLKAPFTLIKLLELFHPHLLGLDRPLRILYLGAGREEVLDGGRWYGLAWQIRNLGWHMPAITAVGPALANAADWEASPWESMVDAYPALLHGLPGTLAQVLATEEACINWEENFDVVVMHHPGFVANLYDWWGDDAWMDLAGFAEVPIIGTSFDAVDAQFDKHGLAASGRIMDRIWWNPAAHVNPAHADRSQVQSDTRLQWGGVLWSTKRDPQFVDGMSSRNQEDAARWFQRYHTGLFDNHQALVPFQHWYYTCPMQFDDVHQHLMVTDDIRIEVHGGKVEAFGQTIEPGPIALEVLAMTRLEQRLARAPALLEELGARLDLGEVARIHALRYG